MDNEGAGPAVSSVQAEELTVQEDTLEQAAPVITVQAGRMNVYLDTNGDYYAAYESKYLGDSLLPFPSRNLYDTLVALSPATIPKSTIFHALSLFGNGENSSFGNTGLPC